VTQDTKDIHLPNNDLNDPAEFLSAELSRISTEIQSVNSAVQAQLQQTVAKMRSAMEVHFRTVLKKSVERLDEQFDRELQRRSTSLPKVEKEISRVTTELENATNEITGMLNDPSVELSKVIRKRAEQAELRAYRAGLQFSLAAEAPPGGDNESGGGEAASADPSIPS